MFALQVTFNEKTNSIKVHGHGTRPTVGEKNVAQKAVAQLQRAIAADLGSKFNSDVKIKGSKTPTLAGPNSEIATPDDLLALLASSGIVR